MRLVFTVWWVLASSALALGAAGELSSRRAPGFALPESSVKYHDLADYRGKVVLLDIMQSRCENCQKLTRTLEKVKATYGDKVAILSVVNPPDNQSTIASYVAKFNVTIPILFDCGQMVASYLKVTPQNPVVHVPHLFIIDQEGMIRNDFGHTEVAIFEGDGLPAEIDRLLNESSRPERKR